MLNTTIGAIVRGDQEVFPPYLYEAYRSTIKRAPGLPLIEAHDSMQFILADADAVIVAIDRRKIVRQRGVHGRELSDGSHQDFVGA